MKGLIAQPVHLVNKLKGSAQELELLQLGWPLQQEARQN